MFAAENFYFLPAYAMRTRLGSICVVYMSWERILEKQQQQITHRDRVVWYKSYAEYRGIDGYVIGKWKYFTKNN